MTSLTCRHCTTPYASKDVNLELGVARCHKCRAVADLHLRTGRIQKPAPIPLPPDVQLDTRAGTFRASWRWFRWPAIFVTVFALVWCGFIAAFIALSSIGGPPTLFLFAPILHVLVGIFLLYWAAAMWVNRTDVSVERRRLKVHHGPLPWPGRGEWDVGSLDQLWVQERTVRTKNGSYLRYDLHARERRNGRGIVLLKDLESRDQALWLEQELEPVMGLEDTPMTGEVEKPRA